MSTEASESRLPVHTVVSTWLLWFAADAALGLADETLHWMLDLHPLMPLRQLSTLMMFFLTAATLFLTGISPRAPLRVVLPPLAWNLWALLGSLPVLVWLFLEGTYGVAITGAQLLAALAGIAGAWSLSGRPWLTATSVAARPDFALRRTVGTVLALPVIALGSVLWLLLNLQYAVSWSTDGYVTVDARGLYMTERVLERGDDHVELVGMVHLAEHGSFDALYERLGDAGPVVILEEGVTDREGALSRAGRGYEKVAARLGLQEQPRAASSDQVEVRQADIDISELSPEALDLIVSIMKFYAADEPLTAMLGLQDSLKDLGGDEAILRLLLAELVERRNDHLEVEVRRALGEGRRVVVPWGALHLPDLHMRLEAEGFSVTRESRRLVIRFSTLGNALRSRDD